MLLCSSKDITPEISAICRAQRRILLACDRRTLLQAAAPMPIGYVRTSGGAAGAFDISSSAKTECA
jgi:hypothetical protein